MQVIQDAEEKARSSAAETALLARAACGEVEFSVQGGVYGGIASGGSGGCSTPEYDLAGAALIRPGVVDGLGKRLS
jgi:hypothetical protein